MIALLVVLTTAPAASAAFGIDGFDGTTTDQSGGAYTQAGGHPDAITTKFKVNTTTAPDGNPAVDGGNIKDAIVSLPAGFVGNPQTMPRCALADFYTPTIPNVEIAGCPDNTAVGYMLIDFIVTGGSGASEVQFPTPVYNLEPGPNRPARFGAMLLSTPIILEASVRTGGDYGLDVSAPEISQGLQVAGVSATFWGTPADPVHDSMRGACAILGGSCPAGTPPRPFLRMPTSCQDPQAWTLRLDSWTDPGNFHTASFVSHDPAGNPVGVNGCEQLDFSPSLSAQPTTQAADSPSGLSVRLAIPQNDLVGGRGEADLKDVVVRLPAGMTVSPSSAEGLQGCSEAQIGLKNDRSARCPDASKIGTVEVDTPLLEKPLRGGVYVAQQGNLPGNGSNPFGSLLAIYIVAEGSGVVVKLPGKVEADPVTGRLTTTFADNPQLPFSEMKVNFFGGPRAALATPAACGTFNTVSALSPWSGTPAVDLASPMTINQGCAGLGWFGPYFSAGTVNPTAGASSPFVLRVNKPDGQSDLNGIALSLPEGLLGNLKGNIGRQIGTARVAAGVGPNPFWLSGPVVLEGPYKGAPFSLKVTVPAIAGPFNLGDVVVRQKLYVDPHDAHVTVVSDPLPTILQGIPVQLHDLAVDIDKAGFMRNPTSCAPKSIGGTLGAWTGQTAAVASRFQVGDCANLPLAPKMRMDLVGKKETSRGKHPMLSTTLTQQPGESALKKVKVRLPLSLALDPDNAEALCKPEQAAVKACPAASIVGKAVAVSPVLNQPLRGDVFFVEGTRKSKTGRVIKTLPKLWVALRGEVAIDLWADSSISQGKYLVTTFPFVPDAPISSFKLDINGGQHGILAVTGDTGANLCKQANVTQATYDGQNGKQVTDNVRMSSPCGFRVRSKSLTKTHAKVTLSGLGAGKLSISGKGIHKAHRTIKHSDVATITPRLTESGMRTAKRGKALRLRVTWNPKAKDAKTRHARATVKRAAKASSTRARRSHRTR